MEIILRLLVLINFLCFGFGNGQNYNVLNFGAKGDGQTDDSNAFVKTWNATCGAQGGMTTTLVIPADKTFLLQPVVFQGPCKPSSIKFMLDGVIVAPSNKEAWSNPKSTKWISFSTISGLMLVGSGKINGRGSSFWEQKPQTRPTALHFYKCDNLMIEGITSIDPPRNHLSIQACNGAAISNIHIIAPENSPNTDGMDISSSTRINVFDSTFQTGDDCIAINTGSFNINITKVNCGPGHGISVGSLGFNGTKAEVSDVRVTHCTFSNTTNGARIKTWLGGQGYAKDISFENITLTNAKNPIIIDQYYIDKGRDDEKVSAVAISNIKFIDFRGTTVSKDSITLKCSATTCCKGVEIDGINITMTNGEKPNVFCQYVDGHSNDTNLMRDCFKNNTTADPPASDPPAPRGSIVVE